MTESCSDSGRQPTDETGLCVVYVRAHAFTSSPLRWTVQDVAPGSCTVYNLRARSASGHVLSNVRGKSNVEEIRSVMSPLWVHQE